MANTNTGKSFKAVIEERDGMFQITGHDGVRGVCVLPHDAHRCTTVAELVAKLDEMATVYGWTVSSVDHRKDTAEGSVWTSIR